MRIATLGMAVALLGAACSDGTTTPETPLAGNARLRVVHTLKGVSSVDVLVGGKVAISNLAFGQVSAVTAVPEGAQDISFRPTGTGDTGHATSLNLQAGDTTTILTVDSSTIINPWVLTDSNTVVPAQRSKLRVVQFAETGGDLLAWRTQPDYQDFITLQFPFPFRTATPYVESYAGDWHVLVSTASYDGGLPVMTDTLATSGALSIPSGESRTVIVIDADGGGVALVVLTP